MTKSLLPQRLAPVHYLLAILALGNIALLAFVAFSHLRVPFNLEPMETTVLEHVRRAMTGSPVYVEPTAQFTPLTFNPLFYYVCALFARFLGLSLTTLREVALLGTAGCGVMLFLIMVRETRSKWWGIMTAGLFAASYQALDSYYDVGQLDTWLVFLVLAGCYLIGYSDTRLRDGFGMLYLVAAFWMKQQGAIFVLGGLAFLLWRDLRAGASPTRSWPSAVIALVFGPLLYLLLPDTLTGPAFHHLTWTRHWAEVTREEIRTFAEFLARRFTVPAALAGAGLQLSLERGRPLGIWGFFLPVAFLSAVLATLTPGSNLNVFIPFGIWLILNAVLALPRLVRAIPWLDQVYFPATALGLCFLAFIYKPSEVLKFQNEAKIAWQDLGAYIQELDGPVYTPSIGPMASGSELTISIDDMQRGPGAIAADMAVIHHIRKPASQAAYILNGTTLKDDPRFQHVADSYILEQDLGDRFSALQGLPRRHVEFWPRYLYRYDPQAVLRLSAARTRH